ncbi:FxSxx-COOH cyclophane-containing RiPP peptide [Actinomadura madurae]|uniref:FxSxx-COOH cyclophane-containing RiPP peptide n=1 Tax=Actinomadura madurae TaxID=1993 RepID=UPI002026B811|nr:FxSxx-COOH cyclophane-containing RiPP peptide [Actinomadura madurae]MCP9953135.1 FxSxx-COOH protein [Actinomadura madurae]MCP9969901.1 FxSxx-COOH protein [Actinomadura madurae]MCP9982349.1 FxSxx-COOH protein [Actinomadura madurae]MCQ0006120.1 FxSxx-COOH protein [Actinomadura madurae]MCQ0018597.1 FxSxx-COOH protein [Actinomadura madurae]
MPETSNIQVNRLDFSEVSMDRLDEISESALWHAVNEILDPRQDGDAIAAFNSFAEPPGDNAT